MSHHESPTEPSGNWRTLSDQLTATLKPFAAPIAITFLPPGQHSSAARLDDECPAPNEQGRTGQVPAGCVFWVRGATQTFTTTAADHANCSVGSFTHGFLTLEEAASKDDVCAVLDAGWVDGPAVSSLPRVTEKPGSIVYGPLAESATAPDVVLVRINGFGLMTLRDALPELRIEGKPQCHIIAMAKEQGVVTASVGCALSRTRTGMRPEEMTCAIPASRLAEVVGALERTVALNRMMSGYAAADATRF